ncbi:MAG: hypothetical protein HW388_244 [Dehalococcoidia bacterium]|nr:hypothetical protein [Dehalococcoidia bacterium]
MIRGVTRVFLGMTLILGLLLLASPGYAQETIDIEGQVLNGTLDADAPQGLTVTLEVFKSGESLETRETVADDQGHFLFAGVVGGENHGYIISAEYGGVTYTYESDYPLPSEPVDLVVYESTSSSEAIRVAGHTLMVGWAESKSRLMTVFELVSLENTGDRTFVPDITTGGPMDILRFSLPTTASELDVRSSLQEGQLIQVGAGFALLVPVPPGGHELHYTFVVPYEDGKMPFTHSFPLGADVFRVLLLQDLGQVSGTGLQEVEPLLFEDGIYQQLVAEGLEAGAKLTLEFTGLPQQSSWQRWRDAMPGGDLALWAVPGVFGLALLALLAYVLLRRGKLARTRSSAREGEGQDPATIEDMARLDDQFQRGELGREEYLQRRRELREKLLRQGGPPAPP